MTGTADKIDLTLETTDNDCNIVFAKDSTGSQTLHSNVGLKYNAFNGDLTVQKDIISNNGFLYLNGNGGDIHTAGGSDGIAVIQNTKNEGQVINGVTQKSEIRIAGKNSSGSNVTIASFIIESGQPILRCDGDLVAFAGSDRNLKDNITPIPNALDKVNAISGNTFTWKPESPNAKIGNDTGVIAQEIEALGLPGLTTTRDDGTKAVRYERIVPVLIEAIKELSAKVTALENK